MFFDKPTQVKFYDGEDWNYGIAYHEIIICGCCGGIFEIDDVLASGHSIEQLTWIPLNEEIKGT